MTTTCLAVLVDRANEQRARDGILELLGRKTMRLVLVDASVDAQATDWLAQLPGRGQGAVTVLPPVAGSTKAEAVRRGLNGALAQSADIIGYVSDGFATPAGEVLRLCDSMSARACSVLLGARVAMLGTDVHRSVLRHYLGRGFAMLASTILGADIYDTQCGVKLFRPSPALAAALARPFRAQHAFDVELLARLIAGAPGAPALTVRDIVEVPLAAWDGRWAPPIGPAAAAAAFRELLQIGLTERR